MPYYSPITHTILTFTLLLSAFLSGCTTPSEQNTSIGETTNSMQQEPISSDISSSTSDSDPQHSSLPEIVPLQKQDGYVWGGYGKDGFYYIRSSARADGSCNIMYADYSSGNVFYLCSQANCTHNNSSCSSYIVSGSGGVSPMVVGEKLILVCQKSPYVGSDEDKPSHIITTDLDGSNRTVLAQFKANQFLEKPMLSDGNYLYFRLTTQVDATTEEANLVRIDCSSGKVEFLRSMDTTLNERIWGSFGGKILVYRYMDDNIVGLVSWDLNNTSTEEVLFTWNSNDSYPILGDDVLSYIGDDGYFHLKNLQSKEDISLSQYSIPVSDISNISVTPLFVDDGHLLIRELRDSECTYYVLDTNGNIQTFDLLYDVDGDSDIFYPITSVDENRYLVCCGFSVQNEASSLDDGSSTVLPVPDRLYAIIDKNDYWHSVKDSQVFE